MKMQIFVAAFYWFLAWVLRLLSLLLVRRRVEGLENVPKHGSLIIAVNHFHQADPALLMASLPRRVIFMAKRELLQTPLIGPLFALAGCIPVRRFEADLRALRQARQALAAGLALGMFPEGTRSKTGTLGQGWPGSALLALQSQAPILPIGITGSAKITGIWSLLKRPPILVRIGEPFRLPPGSIGAREVQEGTEAIMQRIAALLPPEYRGVYGQEAAVAAGPHPQTEETGPS
ncbi:MAG TPA: lysophospholipid acyltransferase family protein [Dehalococcoidia bacterium]|nr:lysophospholipid acyltransferase family protein [Dehalococcoidia bacterium]HLB28803.1 lysophospholipid acyltransferase family protein [Dehalococcoidia bacterium]HLE02441.1 lysophospholipid acyltransferase family protein [Dehalococcoidia bacterium]